MTLSAFLALLAILLFATFLRFFKLKERGLLYWDDGVRLREVLFLDDLVAFISWNFKGLLSREKSLKEASENFRGQYLFDCNPLNIFLYWATSKCAASVEYSGLFANGFLGVVSILGVFFLGDLIGGIRLGLLSALALSLSGYHLNYSRSIHAEMSCGAFYVWATYFYLSSVMHGSFTQLAIAGILVGCAFACNSRQFYIPIFFAGYEALFFFFFSTQPFLPRILVLGVSMFFPLLVIEELFLFLRVTGYPCPTYFMQLYERTGQNLSLAFRFPSFKLYLKTFYDFEGFFFILLLVGGSLNLLKTFSFERAVLFSQWMIPILFWSLRPTEALSVRKGSMGGYACASPRLASSAIFSMSVMIAFCLNSYPSYLRYSLVVFCAMALYKSGLQMRVLSGYKKAIEFIRSQGNGMHISFCHPISDFYLDPENVIHFDSFAEEKELEEVVSEKSARFYLHVPVLYVNSPEAQQKPYLQKILSQLKPVYTVERGFRQFLPFYNDDSSQLDPKILNPDLLEVYDLLPLSMGPATQNRNSAAGRAHQNAE